MSPIKHFRSLLLTTCIVVACCAAGSAQASSVSNTSYFTFTGTCNDCTGTGVGTLELVNYSLGNDITADNFVDFSYSSNLISFDLDSSASDVFIVNGSSLPDTLPSTAFVGLEGDGILFFSFQGGGWCTGSGCAADNGPDHLWSVASAPTSAAPEPAAAFLTAPALFGLWWRRRSRKRG
jgi:MYXO-CTERM domain-containing protein